MVRGDLIDTAGLRAVCHVIKTKLQDAITETPTLQNLKSYVSGVLHAFDQDSTKPLPSKDAPDSVSVWDRWTPSRQPTLAPT